MKKLLSLALALVLILSVPAFAADITMYVDISQIVDPAKTVRSVVGTVYDDGDTEDVAVTHVSGNIYSYIETHEIEDYVYGTPSFIIEVFYGEEDGVSAPVIYNENEAGIYNLYTFGADGAAGTWSTYTPASTGPSVTNGDKNVTGKYVAGAESKPIYKVDISWGSMAFTYTAASKGTWKTDSHTYEGATTAKWTWESGANEVKVTNHSNDGITVTPSYTPDTGYENTSMTFDNASLTLTTADNGEGDNGTGKATTGTITVTPGGSVPADTSGKIGQITLSIAGANNSTGGDTTDEKAIITGVEVRVGSTFYKSGDTVTLTPDSDSVIIFAKGTNLQNRTDDNKIQFEISTAWPMGTEHDWTVNTVGTEAYKVFTLSKFKNITEPFEIQYSNDGGKTYTMSGLKIVYDASGSTTDKAIITGLSITIDGVTYDSSNTSETNPAKITDDSIKNGVTITLTGTNLNNLTEGYVVQTSLGVADTMMDKWDSNSDGTAATKKYTTKTWFSTNTNAFEIRYTNVGSEVTKSAVYIIYDAGNSTGGNTTN